MIHQIMMELKQKHQVLPQKSMLLVSPNYQEFTVGLKQWHCYLLMKEVYNYLYGYKSQDTSLILINQQKVESVMLRVIKSLSTKFKINSRQNIFTIFSDYMEIIKLKDEVNSLTSEEEKVAGYLMLLIMLASSEVLTTTERIVIPFGSVVTELPAIYLIKEYDEVVKNFEFSKSFFKLLNNNRPNLLMAEYLEKIGTKLMNETSIKMIRTASVINASRKGSVTRTHFKSLLWLDDAELVSMCRSVLNVIINHFNMFHIEMVSKELTYLSEDKKAIGTYLQFVFGFFDKIVGTQGVLNTMKIKEMIDALGSSVDITNTPVTDETLKVMHDIVETLVQGKVSDSTEWSTTIVDQILSILREEIRINSEIAVIKNIKELSLRSEGTASEDLKLVEDKLDFDPIPTNWFKIMPIHWRDLMLLSEKLNIVEKRAIVTEQGSETKEIIHSIKIDDLPIYSVNKAHNPIPIQLDRIDESKKSLFYLTPLPLNTMSNYLSTIKEYNSQIDDLLKSLVDSRVSYYLSPVADEITNEQINADMELIKKLKTLSAPILSTKYEHQGKSQIVIFDLNESKRKIPMVIPKNKEFTPYVKYEVVKDEQLYRIILVPENEVDAVSGISLENFFINRVPSSSIPEISLTYDERLFHSQVDWNITVEFAKTTRIECQWLNDIDNLDRVVNSRRAHLVKLSIDEILARAKFRSLINFAIENSKTDQHFKIVGIEDVFKLVYNSIFDKGSDLLALDSVVRLYGKYDSISNFAYKNSMRNLDLVIKAVVFYICRLAYTEQAAIKYLPIPRLFSDNKESLSRIKTLADEWFSDSINVSDSEIKSTHDTIYAKISKSINDALNLNTALSVPRATQTVVTKNTEKK